MKYSQIHLTVLIDEMIAAYVVFLQNNNNNNNNIVNSCYNEIDFGPHCSINNVNHSVYTPWLIVSEHH